jgi:NADH-quinone oxidoreductase subunit F
MASRNIPLIRTVEDLEKARERFREKYYSVKRYISVCGGTGCRGGGCLAVAEEIKNVIKEAGLEKELPVRLTGCHGFCERGPLVVVYPQKIFYQKVKPVHARKIVLRSAVQGEVIEELLYEIPEEAQKVVQEEEVPFYKHQMRLIFGMNGMIDPENIEDYIALGGYSALRKALFEMQPEQIIEEVKKSGLRGRGGAGFPTGRKWESVRRAKSRDGIKYVICNADEGDPGAFMDRSLIEGNPHSVLEGMIIGAFAIGAHQGYVYIRREYPLALKMLTRAIQQAREYGFLGENILGSGFSFDIGINRGGGAFVCGESSALMASMEGKVGEPRPKYVHMSEKGLWERPTCLNNVETWANVPLIINKGADWYASIGTEKSKGTKIFSLVGKVNNTGLIEVPMGITLRQVIYDIGGGIKGGRKFKAVQTGGPSGGVIPESLLDLPVDFDRLTEVGSMMGSGGMIVMDDRTCMVDVARYFVNFLTEESCGKCVPCREGVKRMKEIIDRIAEGKGKRGDLELLEEMGGAIADGSLCGLGQSAPNPVLSSIKYFREEWEAHIKKRKCPAGVCKELITYSIDPEKCTGCMACIKPCPEQCITGERKKPHVLDASKCIKCGACFDVCKYDAVVRQ